MGDILHMDAAFIRHFVQTEFSGKESLIVMFMRIFRAFLTLSLIVRRYNVPLPTTTLPVLGHLSRFSKIALYCIYSFAQYVLPF
jgi:hypothetical protein